MFYVSFNIQLSCLKVAWRPYDFELRLPGFVFSIQYDRRLEGQDAFYLERHTHDVWEEGGVINQWDSRILHAWSVVVFLERRRKVT